MENIDVILLTYTKDLTYYGMTQRAINTLKSSEGSYNFDVKVVESSKNAASQQLLYTGCTTIVPDEKFGYNRFLNHALKHCKNEWVVVGNNDLIFMPGWFSEIMRAHVDNPEIKSFSPYEPNWHALYNIGISNKDVALGYRSAYEITGWCIVINREIIDNCKLFDPQFDFLFQDDDYAETLRNAGYKHALVKKSIVYHVFFQSHELNKETRQSDKESGEAFKKKWPNAPVRQLVYTINKS
jgi:hypothetical protein